MSYDAYPMKGHHDTHKIDWNDVLGLHWLTAQSGGRETKVTLINPKS